MRTSTQNQALSAVLGQLSGQAWLAVALLYGCGMRLQELLELRVKDLDIEQRQVIIRRGKGQKDRRTVLPDSVLEKLTTHLATVAEQHTRDAADGCGRVVQPVGTVD